MFTRRGALLVRVIIVLLALAVVGAGAWWWHSRSKSNFVAALTANNRGVGYMEQYNYARAINEFEQVVRFAPDWLPGRINLGIALLNKHGDEDLKRAVELFKEILKEHPDDPYAHFSLGIILAYKGQYADAVIHFKRVTEIDPQDPDAWYQYGLRCGDDPKTKLECFQRAVELDPYHKGALYGLAMELRQRDMQKTKELLAQTEELHKKQPWFNGPTKEIRYTEMGRYGTVIGLPMSAPNRQPIGPIPLFKRDEAIKVNLRPGARWATSRDFGEGPAAELRRLFRDRFGATLVTLDYNRDGKLDLFLVAAVVIDGKVEDVLLRNDGGGTFTDVTVEAGLAGARPSVGCCVADFDNDGNPDLFITGIEEQHLFRNTGRGRFEDVTARAGLDKLKTVCLGAAFADLDQDGDMDLVVAQFAENLEKALNALRSNKPDKGPGLAVFLNAGAAPVSSPAEDPPPLEPRFQRLESPRDLLAEGLCATSVVVSDLDGDFDLDVLALGDGGPVAMILNDRLLRFHRAEIPPGLVPPGRWNGGLVFDSRHRGRSDLFLIGPSQSPVLLLSQEVRGRGDAAKWFEKGNTNSPPLLQAQAIDLDLDGRTDIVGLSQERAPVFLHNTDERLAYVPDVFGAAAQWPKDLLAFAAADFKGDGYPDLVVWSEAEGLRLYVNQGNGNHSLLLDLVGHRRPGPLGEPSRCNADGFGTVARVQVQDHWSSVEYATLSAGLGQSRQPILLGLGKHAQPEVLRLHWPDNVWQAEFNLSAKQVNKVDEVNRKEVSCPILFAWNGQRFVFVTDFLGAGSMGELQPDRSCRPPRPEESVKIESEQMAPLDGNYVMKVSQPMNEVVYLDRLQVVVLDHPSDMRVYPDERFVSIGAPANQDLLAFREMIFPITARDHRGQDVTQKLRSWDRDTVDGFRQRAWLGYAEEHWVELDFGSQFAKFSPETPLVLCMAGWTDYPYPESIWAATQAGVPLQPPVLERLGPDGKWHELVADAGFPAGLPRMMTLDVTGKLAGPSCKVRLRTNMQVFWDQIFVAPLVERAAAAEIAKSGKWSGTFKAICLPVSKATLQRRGCVQEYSPDGRRPTIYNDERVESVPVSLHSGNLTRTGDVTELLQERDDCFVIFGPGDEVTVHFDARTLPALPRGWTRSFVLRTWGYSKDNSHFTATGETIEPLPFRAMTKYPYGPDESYPRDRLHDEYRRRFNTRQVGTGK